MLEKHSNEEHIEAQSEEHNEGANSGLVLLQLPICCQQLCSSCKPRTNATLTTAAADVASNVTPSLAFQMIHFSLLKDLLLMLLILQLQAQD